MIIDGDIPLMQIKQARESSEDARLDVFGSVGKSRVKKVWAQNMEVLIAQNLFCTIAA